MKSPAPIFAALWLCGALFAPAFATSVELGNDPNGGGSVDGWSSIMVIDEDATYTNTSAVNELVTPQGFDFQVGSNRGRVTPFLVKVNGDNSFTVVAVGKTRVSGTDYNSGGVFEFDFSDSPPEITLAPGEILAPGMTNANPDGSGNAGSVIPYSGANEVWLTGGGGSTAAGSVAVGLAPGSGGSTLTNLNRTYAYAIDADVVPETSDPPTDITYSGGQPLPGMPIGAVLGNFAATDPNPGDSHTFSIVTNPGGLYAIVGDALQTASAVGSAGSSATIRVRAVDLAGNPFEENFTMTVDAPVDPTAVTLDSSEVNAAASAGSAVGVMGAVDGNAADAFTFSLVPGSGDTDNALFSVDGPILRLAAAIPVGRGTVSLRLRGTDLNGGFAETSFVLSVVTPSVVISEFISSNSNGLLDEDGDSSDWIEIQNVGAGTVDLGGWHLTDNSGQPTKWTFPAEALAPGEYLIVFASSKDRAVAGSELHTNFLLSASGEYVGLYNPGGLIVADEHTGVPQQYPEIAYGRGSGGDVIGYLDPTPEAANGTSYAEPSDEVTFSHPRGSYPATLLLTLGSPTGTQIRYTMDGSKPTSTTGTLYSVPFSVSPPTSGNSRGVRMVRAIAFGGTGLRTPVATHTYVFVDQAKLQSVLKASITGHATYGPLIDDALLAHPIVSLTTTSGGTPGGSEIETSIEFFDPSGGEPGFQIDCGIKVVGGHSTGSQKNNFRLYFRSDYGYTELDYPLFAAHPYSAGAAESFDRLNLRSGSHDTFFWLANPGNPSNSGGPTRGDAQYFRNRWINDMALRMGQPALHGRWAQVFMNGVYHGQYHILEFPNEDFHASYLGGASRDYEFTNGANTSKTGSDNWQAVWSQVKSAASAGGASAASWVDFENLADYMVLNFYAGNPWDWNPNQNWMAGGPSSAGAGGWKFYCWDADIIFQDPGADVLNKNVPDGLFQTLINDPEFEIVFRDRVYLHCFHDGLLTPMQAQATFDMRAAELETSIVAETARWQGAAANPPWDRDDEWDTELARMRTAFFPSRHSTLMNQLRAKGWYPTEAPEFDQRGGEVSSGHQPVLTSTTPGSSIYYTTDGSDPREPGGTVASGATPYTPGSITVTGGELIRTRAKNGAEWSAINEAAFILTGTVPADSGNLLIAELHYHPAAPTAAEVAAGFTDDDDFEFIELTNTATVPIDLSGVRFTTGVVFEFPPATTLLPGGRLVVVRNQAAFQQRYPGVATAAITGQFHSPVGDGGDERLSNSGERIVLLDAADAVIADFTYNDEDPWPKDADGSGSTLVLRQRSGSHGDALNWRASVAVHGTPTGDDSVPYPGGDVLDYAMAEPGGAVTLTGSGKIELAYLINLAADDASYSLWISPDLVTWTQSDELFKVDRRQNFGNGTVEMEYQTLDPVTEVRSFYELRVTVDAAP